MKKTLVWRFDDEVDRMPMQAVRLVVRTASMRDYGEFQRLTRLATEIWEQRFPLLNGNSVTEEVDGEAAVDAPESVLESASEGSEAAGEKPRQTRAEGSGVYLDVYRRWARLVAATAAVEVLGAGQQTPVFGKGKKGQPAPVEIDWDASQDAWPWSPSSLAALGWDKPDPIMDVPTDFFFAWEQAVLDVNPGVWGAARTSDAPNAKKKTGLVAIY